MNRLSYRGTDENGLSFELLVDDRPLGELVGAPDPDWAIPFWDIVDDLPYWPPHGPTRDPQIRIVCCCSCGEYGCGHTRCQVVHEGEEVVFKNFENDVSPEGKKKEFRFSAANYKAVISEIVARALAQPRHT